MLFNTLYADTFSMMKDTVTDMRRHMWPESDDGIEQLTEERVEEKIREMRMELRGDVEAIASSVSAPGLTMEDLDNRLEQLVDRAIASTRETEREGRNEAARLETIRAIHAVHLRMQGEGGVTTPVLDDVVAEARLRPGEVRGELQGLARERLISIQSDSYRPGVTTIRMPNSSRLFGQLEGHEFGEVEERSISED